MYLLDSNTLIQSHRLHHPFDVFPSFWSKLQEHGLQGNIRSLDKVYQELVGADDMLSEWVRDLPQGTFLRSDVAFESYQTVTQWAIQHPQYNAQAKEVFLEAERADAWLVAYAREHQCTVVTWEVASPGSRRHIKIPDACVAFDVTCINPMQMMRALGIRI